MKLIDFKNKNSQRIYTDYLNRSKHVLRLLSKEDQEDSLMELNSYIFEYMQNHQSEDETTALLNILERLGSPEETLKEVVASKKIEQAVKTYNIKHLLVALFLNLRNGVVYVILFFLTLLLVCFPILIVLEILFPEQTGLFVGKNTFMLGYTIPDENKTELLGNAFIPFVVVLGVFLYFFIIFLLKIVKNKKS